MAYDGLGNVEKITNTDGTTELRCCLGDVLINLKLDSQGAVTSDEVSYALEKTSYPP